jgi:hypothetical protein
VPRCYKTWATAVLMFTLEIKCFIRYLTCGRTIYLSSIQCFSQTSQQHLI